MAKAQGRTSNAKKRMPVNANQGKTHETPKK